MQLKKSAKTLKYAIVQVIVINVFNRIILAGSCKCCNLISYSTLPYPTLPYPTLPYPTLPYSTLLYPTLPYSTLLYSTVHALLLWFFAFHIIGDHCVSALRWIFRICSSTISSISQRKYVLK